MSDYLTWPRRYRLMYWCQCIVVGVAMVVVVVER